jgi:putative ABC transport system ATP-binding protein
MNDINKNADTKNTPLGGLGVNIDNNADTKKSPSMPTGRQVGDLGVTPPSGGRGVIIQIDNLIKRFPIGKGEFTALKGINLTFGTGEFAGLIGPSGSGKTTLLNIIGSLDTPTDGKAIVLGKSIKNLSAKESAQLRKESLGFIFQSYNLLQVHTVFENVEFPLLLLNYTTAERKKMVMDALEWVGLTDKVKSKPPQLSGGECQRVAIARAMVKKPSLVLADEPTANLDAANSHNILKTMEKLNRELKTTFIFATHDEKVIGYLKRKIFLKDGLVDHEELINN